jgi:hypothetical protein
LRKTRPGGFAAQVVVYDGVENKAKEDSVSREDAVSLILESSPNAFLFT